MTGSDTATELVITRVFDAPREQVWKAWTDPEHFKKWWGPEHFTAPVSEIDLRVGGTYFNCMRSPDGKDYYTTGVYREIVPWSGSCTPIPSRIRTAMLSGLGLRNVRSCHGDGSDRDVRGAGRQNQDDPAPLRLPAGEHSDMAEAGWNGSFDKLAESLR